MSLGGLGLNRSVSLVSTFSIQKMFIVLVGYAGGGGLGAGGGGGGGERESERERGRERGSE